MDQLDQQRERVQADLRGVVNGEVRCDDVFRQLFASDGSIHEIKPLAVVRPRNALDVAACVQYASEEGLPLHARGAGTGVAGESLGPGVVVDFSRYLRRVINIDQQTVTAQPGVVLERLNAQLHRQKRILGPDPGTYRVTTLGSAIAVDAAGSRWLRFGSTRPHVRRLQLVLADGHIIHAGREPLTAAKSTDPDPRKRRLVDQLTSLLIEKAEVIRASQSPCPVNRCGYQLTDVLSEGHLDLAKLLVGSEGTLALVTEATLSTEPLARYRGVSLLLFDRLEQAARASREILHWQPTACDLVDRRHISLARETEVRFDLLIPAETEAVLLVEHEGDDAATVRQQMQDMADDIWHQKRMAFGVRRTFDSEETVLYWSLVDKVQPALYAMKGPRRPVPVIEDVAVPPEILPDFLVRMQNVLKRHQVIASTHCHTGQGQLHVQPFLDLADPADVERMRRLTEELYQEVFDVGGTISGEHAVGLSRTSFVRRQVGDEMFEVFRRVKRIFDPDNLFNPGKVVGDDPGMLTRNLREIPPPPPSPTTRNASLRSAMARRGRESVPEGLRNLTELQLDWDPDQAARLVADCNRCGECRTQAADTRMCPIFRIAPAEEASPRAKVNLMLGVLGGQVNLTALSSEQFKAVADLCVHCHMCRLECPAHIDIPRLMRDGKGAFVRANGLLVADWAMTRLDLLARLAGLVRPLSNWALGNRQMRWLLEKTLGIAQGRKLPRLASRSFLRRAARRRLTRPTRGSGAKVLYFVDLYANYFDTQLAMALVKVLEHNGVAVYVHPHQKQAGMPSIACGALDHARHLAEHNVAILAEAIRQGYHVVTTEPSAALALTREYPQLLENDDEALAVAENTSEACSYLWKLHMRGQLQLDFKPIHTTFGYHTPCHLKALGKGTPGVNLLGLVPGVRVIAVEEGCSGMAGTFGIKRANYRSSLRAGWRLISRLRDPAIAAGATECSVCKIQMEQGTTKPTIHPVKLLAMAYNLMPEAGDLLAASSEELIAT